MQPINYSVDVGNPFASSIQGFQSGGAMQQQQAQQQQLQFQQQQQQSGMQQQQQMQSDLAALSQKADPSATDFARITIKYPQLAEHFKNTWAPLNAEQQQQKISMASQVMAAVNAGRPDIAQELFQRQAEAARNSGNQKEADSALAMAKIIEANPGAARTSAAAFMASVLGPDKFTEFYNASYKAPIEAKKSELEVSNLPNKYALENQNAFQDIETKKLNRDISVLDSQIKSADSETKRGELQLKRDELVGKRDEKLQEKQIDAQTKLDMVSTSLDSIKQVFQHPELESSPLTRSARAKIPGTDAVDFSAMIDTVKSQQFIDNIAKMKSSGGTGALSDAEGKKIGDLIGSLDIRQSNTSLKNALGQIKTTLERAQQRVIGQGNLPRTEGTSGGGSTYVMKHPKYGVITDAVINSLLAAKPGMTRDQAVQFFKESGGK